MLQRSSSQLRQLVLRKATSSQLAASTLVLSNGFRMWSNPRKGHTQTHDSKPFGSRYFTAPQAMALAAFATASLTAATFCSASSGTEAGLIKPREGLKAKPAACGSTSCSGGDQCMCNPCLCGGKRLNKDGKVVTGGCKCSDNCTCNPCRCGEPGAKTASGVKCKCGPHCTCDPCHCAEGKPNCAPCKNQAAKDQQKTAVCKCGDKCHCRATARATCYDSAEQFLFPKIEPYKTGHLQVSKIHSLYYEECGNPNGKPVIMVHGGPGAGCNETMRRYHDPKVYRIILLDQRGSGRSTPHACLDDNTTWHLIEDMEKLRRHLKIDKWQVFGGSWGSTLSIAYAISHPDRVLELVLRGIFHVRKQEIDFYYQHGANFLYPDRWEAYRDAIPEEERGDFVKAYHTRLTSENPNVRLPAALAWTTWERTTSNLIPPTDAEEKSMNETKFAEAFARIENHYFYHQGFFPTDQYLLEHAFKIRHIPSVIVQGRYDVVCPIKTAWDFHKVFPEADLRIVQTAGHSAMEPGIAQELVDATNRFKDLPSL